MDEELEGNLLGAGVVEEFIPLGDLMRMEVSAEGRLWQVEHPWASLQTLDLRPGHPVRLALTPRRIEEVTQGS